MTLARFIHFRQTLGARDRAVLDALAARIADICTNCGFPLASDQVSRILQSVLPTFSGPDIDSLTLYIVNSGRSQPTGAAAGGEGQSAMLESTRQLTETQMAFNRQYLQLQNQMAEENASYKRVSNIMKTKHDTVKNSISNVR